VKIPYTEIELLVALIELQEIEFDMEQLPKQIKELQDEQEADLPKDKIKFLERVAKEHSISFQELLKKSNCAEICQEYLENSIRKSMKKLAEKVGITEIQAWALFVSAMEDPDLPDEDPN
jgi:hypothetical protein